MVSPVLEDHLKIGKLVNSINEGFQSFLNFGKICCVSFGDHSFQTHKSKI